MHRWRMSQRFFALRSLPPGRNAGELKAHCHKMAARLHARSSAGATRERAAPSAHRVRHALAEAPASFQEVAALVSVQIVNAQANWLLNRHAPIARFARAPPPL